MKQNSQIQALCFRYVLPFYYELSFNEALELVQSQEKLGKWEKVYTDTESQESDLFEYIREEFLFEKGEANVSDEKGGACWRWAKDQSNKKAKPILELLYFEQRINKTHKELPPHLNISVAEMGLILYKNHLGMLWYEISVPYDVMNVDQLIRFQNCVKELNRAYGRVHFWEKCSAEPDYGIAIPNVKGRFIDPLTNGKADYITPFLMGKWLKDQIGFLENSFDNKRLRFFAERKSAYPGVIMNGMETACGLQYFKKDFPGIEENETKKEYRKRLMDSMGNVPEMVPDKPLLFSYCLLDLVEESMPDYTFRLGNGYTPAYLVSEEARQEIRHPFANAWWSASQEGVAYCAKVTPENIETFRNIISRKIRIDYFTLYLKVLYQSFSLLIFAERIQKEVPASMAGKDETAFTEPITKLLGEISLFLTKSMATSVSHIHHQSEFYNYLKQRLRVKEDVESVTAGMNALEVLMREESGDAERQRDNKMQTILAMFTLLGLFSALADCKSFFDNFESLQGIYYFCLAAIFIIGGFTIIYVREVFPMIFHDLKNLLKKKMKK